MIYEFHLTSSNLAFSFIKLATRIFFHPRVPEISVLLPPGILGRNQVYFVWVIRDFGTAEWFHTLLKAIEDEDTEGRIEINIYLTVKMKEDDATNIMVNKFH